MQFHPAALSVQTMYYTEVEHSDGVSSVGMSIAACPSNIFHGMSVASTPNDDEIRGRSSVRGMCSLPNDTHATRSVSSMFSPSVKSRMERVGSDGPKRS